MPTSPRSERTVKKLADWTAEAERLFGPKASEWRFKCVQCGETQTAKDFHDAGLTQDEAMSRAYFSCIGRLIKGRGCDWSLGGLLKFHSVEVLDEEGHLRPVFDFANPLPAPPPSILEPKPC